MQFLRLEFQPITPILHTNQYISGHYFHRYFNQSTEALGVIVDHKKWDQSNKSDFFAPYALPAQFHFDYYNGLTRTKSGTPLFFKAHKIYTLENLLLMDILNPSPDQIADIQATVRARREFQFGGKESDSNGICRYKSAKLYDWQADCPTSNEFIIEFMSDLIPRKTVPDFLRSVRSKLPLNLPADYQLDALSLFDLEKKKYFIKKDMEFQVIPQHFMVHFRTNHPEYNANLGVCGFQGLGKLRSAGFGKFRLRDPAISPLSYHGKYTPHIINFSTEEKQFLKAALLHDLVPKLGGIDFLNDYLETTHSLSAILLKLHYDWHDIRQNIKISLREYLQRIEHQFDKSIVTYYYKLTLADQLAASLTRIKMRPTFSRYLIDYKISEKIDLLDLTQSLLPIESPFLLWKRILKSPSLAVLNESFSYGDQPLSTHLLLTLNFAAYLIRNKTAYVLAKLVPHSEKRFIQGFWYKIFNSTQNEEVFLYLIEEQIPDYPVALVQKIMVKSLRPESSWLRIQ